MVIISKYKDFYDYLQGIYGRDEKIVYERHPKGTDGLFVPDYIKSPGTEFDWDSMGNKRVFFNKLHICGKIYCVHYYDGNFYFGDTLYINDEFYHHGGEALKDMTPEKWEARQKRGWGIDKENHLKDTVENIKNNCPVLQEINSYGKSKIEFNFNVRLTDFGINKIISPHDIYINISNFLSRVEEVEDKRTNKEKIISNGFDTKISFRNM